MNENVDPTEVTSPEPPQATGDRAKSFFSIFIPAEGYFITPIIVNLNILVFIAMIVSGVNAMLPDNDSLIAWGANFRPVTLEGQWWRLLTCCFIHIGLIHLLMNMYALMYIGKLLEPHLGKTRFLSAYILSGIAGSVASLYWHELTISAGASGAIFGMYGVFLAMLTTNLIEKSARKPLLTSIMIFVGFNLINGLKGGIDNSAHMGGLGLGIIIGYAFFPGLKKGTENTSTYFTIAILTVLVFCASFFVYLKTPNDIGLYDQKMKEFIALEAKALSIYNKDSTKTNAQMLKEIENGIAGWKTSIKIINQTDELNLPETIHDKNKKLIAYCQLRVESFQLIYKAYKEDTDKYQPEIDAVDVKLAAVIKELGGGE